MEESGVTESSDRKEELKEEIADILNIVQMLEVSLAETEEDEHIVRSIHIISKLLQSVVNNYLI